MKDYAAMSDSQINEMVHGIIKPESNLGWCFDYCNNPADSWPIIVDNLLRMTPVVHHGSVSWIACRGDYGVSHENPLRAAMIVFLMMKEGE